MAEPERRRRRVRRGPTASPTGAGPTPAQAARPEPAQAARPEPAQAARPEPAQAARPEPAQSPVRRQEQTLPAAAQHPPAPAAAQLSRAAAADREHERGLRGLVGSGSSQVSPGAALRARDAARPTDADLAAAERDVVIIRRNWTPREELPPNR